MTTGGGSVRFNPNLYSSGKVCLSILGTWAGPPWTPAMNIMTVLLSIQSLMCKEPFYNEPGFDKNNTRLKDSAIKYSKDVAYNTMNVAVYGMLRDIHGDASGMPKELKQKLQFMFVYHYDEILKTIDANSADYPTKYSELKTKIITLKQRIDRGEDASEELSI